MAQKSREAGRTQRAEAASARAAALVRSTATSPPTTTPETDPESTPKVNKLPEVVIHEPITTKDRAPEPAESSDGTATPLPVALRDEYSKLAEAAAKLEVLRQAVARLPRSAANEARARAVTQQLRALQNELDDSWRLAGNVAAAAVRNADWAASQAKQPTAKRASSSSPLPLPRPATRASRLVGASAEQR